MKDKDIYDFLKEYKFDFSEEVEQPINELEKKRITKLVKLKIREEENKNKRKNIKQLLITALIALIIIASFSPIGKKVIAEIKEKLFFNPGLGIVSTQEEIYILETPLVVDEDFLIKSLASNKSGIYLDVWFKREGAKKLKGINESVSLKIGDEIIKADSNYSASGGDMDFASLYFKTDKILTEVTLLVYDKEVKVNLEKPESLDGYDEVGETYIDNEVLVGANKYFFNNKTYIFLWSRELYENSEITSLRFDEGDIIARDSEGKEYEVLYSSISGNGREFYIDQIVDRPLEIKISKLSFNYSIENPELIELDIPKENEVIKVNKEIKIESLNKSLIIKEVRGLNNENGDVIETVINLNEDKDEKTRISLINNSKRSGYSRYSEDTLGLDYEEVNERIYGIWREDLLEKEKLFNKIHLELNNFIVEKYGEWSFILE